MIERILAAIAAIGCLAPIASAVDRYVNPGQSIQAAINASQDGDTVHVAAGTYHQSIDFNGKAIAVVGADRSSTILDGTSVGGSVVSFRSGEPREASLRGFTIRGGSGSAYSGKLLGGGVYIDNSSPTIMDCIIEDNHTDIGGGIGHLNSNAYLANCIVRNNTASEAGSYGGAGLYADFGTLTILNSAFTDNESLYSAVGGGMSFQFTRLTAVNCLIARNAAGTWGGGVYNSFGIISLINCTVADNHAGYAGGGVYTRYLESQTKLRNCLVWGNTSEYGHENILDHMDAISSVQDCNVWWNSGLDGYEAENPNFVDAANGNYRLGDASNCIDLGNDAHLILTDELDLDEDGDVDENVPDLDLHDRIFGGTQGTLDLGAFEFQGSTEPEPEPAPCPADGNGDGAVDVTDLLELLANWGACTGPACSSDVDGSGMVDVLDLLALLDAWGACPQ